MLMTMRVIFLYQRYFVYFYDPYLYINDPAMDTREKIMTKSVKEQIHAQITGALKGAKFPVATPKDLIAAFPNGVDTTCQVGD